MTLETFALSWDASGLLREARDRGLEPRAVLEQRGFSEMASLLEKNVCQTFVIWPVVAEFPPPPPQAARTSTDADEEREPLHARRP